MRPLEKIILAGSVLFLLSSCLLKTNSPRIGVDPNSMDCSFCHERTDTTLETGAHAAHLRSNFSLLKDCNLCHPDNSNEHSAIDDIVMLNDLANLENSKNCDSCHNSGIALAKTLWEKPADTWKNDTAYCSICHDFKEDFASGSHKSHKAHNRDIHEGCMECHPDNLKEHTPIDSSVLFTGMANLENSQSCDTCHGTGTDLAKSFWSPTDNPWKSDTNYCMSCHDGSSLINGMQAENRAPFEKISGHGYTGEYAQTQHGANGPGYSCQVCHDPDAPGHIDSIKGDALLKIKNTNSELCLDCHRPGQTEKGILGYKAVSQASRHAGDITGKYENLSNYQYECVVCHGAHGTANLAMVKDTIDGGLGAGPYPITFKDSTHFDVDWKSPDSGGLVDGACDACHAVGEEPHYRTGRGGNHEEGDACWSCHMHTVSFDTMTTYLSEFWIHPEGRSSNRLDSIDIDIAESVKLSSATIGNLDERFDVSEIATWSVNIRPVFSVTDSGKITGITSGTGQVIAVYENFADTVTVNVSNNISLSAGNELRISPLKPTIAVGDSLQFTAEIILSKGVVALDVTDSLTWASNNVERARIGTVKGSVIGVAPGPVSILAYSTDGLSNVIFFVVQP